MKSTKMTAEPPTAVARDRTGRGPGLDPGDLLDDLIEPGLCDVRDRLLEHGASRSMTTGVIRAVLKSGAKGAWAIDAAADALGRSFRILPSPKVRKGQRVPHVIAFVGPTGGGKTTTVAKIGRRLTRLGRKVLYASLDSAGTSALERIGALAADVDRAEIPLFAMRSAKDLGAALARRTATEIVLLDTPGFSPRDAQGLDQLAREVEQFGESAPLDVLLVLPATKSRAAVRLAREGFQRTAPRGCVLTKLDETDEGSVLLEEVGRARLPVAFLCDGMDTRGHLVRPTPARFADLLLRGTFK